MEMECLIYPGDIIHMSVWKTGQRQCFEKLGRWLDELFVTLEMGQSDFLVKHSLAHHCCLVTTGRFLLAALHFQHNLTHNQRTDWSSHGSTDWEKISCELFKMDLRHFRWKSNSCGPHLIKSDFHSAQRDSALKECVHMYIILMGDVCFKPSAALSLKINFE